MNFCCFRMNQDSSPLTSEESTQLIGQSTKPRRPLVESQSFFESLRSADARTWLFTYANVCLIIYNALGITALIFLGSPWTLIGCVIASANWCFLIFAAVSKKVWPLKSSKTVSVSEFSNVIADFLYLFLVYRNFNAGSCFSAFSLCSSSA